MLKLAEVLTLPDQDQYILHSPKTFSLLESDLRYKQKEHFISLFLNTKNRLIFKGVFSVGSINAVIVQPRDVFHATKRRCSASLISAHNHTSGAPEPSIEDVNLTNIS